MPSMASPFESCPNYKSGVFGIGRKDCCGREHENELKQYEAIKVVLETVKGKTRIVQVYKAIEPTVRDGMFWDTVVVNTPKMMSALKNFRKFTPESQYDLLGPGYHTGHIRTGINMNCPLRRRNF